MIRNKILFWQPRRDFFSSLSSFPLGHSVLVISNYLIWILFIIISFLLIKFKPNIFFQLLIASILSELVEKYLKTKRLWLRPFYQKKHLTPKGLIKTWYSNGSFPSGHTIKTVFFYLFIIQYSAFSPIAYLLFTVPLIVFRVISGFHYPIDVLGAMPIGYLIWLFTHQLNSPQFLIDIIQGILKCLPI